MTYNQLKACMPFAKDENISKYLEPLNLAMDKFDINNPRRQAAFLAQLAHESGSLKYVEEIASGEAYEGRADLGNTEPGDGKRFKGRGLIQITGRQNYYDVGKALNFDFIKEPEKMELPVSAAMVSAWFWHNKGLNRIADIDGFERITRKINGGLNGYQDRLAHWERCKTALKVVS